MMIPLAITFVLTYRCNLNCSYCYQVRNEGSMDFMTAKSTIDYFCDQDDRHVVINFYGGEPFLEFDLMKRIVRYATERYKTKNIRPDFTVTTNGTLLDEKKVMFCIHHGVKIYLSIDGTKQAHELGRGQGSFSEMKRILALFRDFHDFPLNVCSLITPDNVRFLFQSVKYLVSLGTAELRLNFDYDREWEKESLESLTQQYRKAYRYLVQYKAQGSEISFKEFRPPDLLQPVFQCGAGRNRFSVTPSGDLYGCSVLIPWSKRSVEKRTTNNFSNFCLGHISTLSKETLKIRLNILFSDDRLSGQYFRYTNREKCVNCDYIMQCGICPVHSLINSEDVFLVPIWVCEIQKILFKIGRELAS